MELAKNINEIINAIDKNIKIVAATKYVNSSDMKKLLAIGINDFGENRVDSFLIKYDELKSESIRWHFIGHLQTNKAKLVISKIDVLHSLDSLRLADIIEKNRSNPLDCFIEVSINEEENKNGVLVKDIDEFIKKILNYRNINLLGLMMMSRKDSSKKEKEEQFLKLNGLMQKINKKYNLNLQELSMGMSDDYIEAIKSGATTIRLGRILWEQEN